MQEISWDDFMRVELRVGRVIAAEPFAQARKPAYILQVDFGPELGVRKSSAQVTALYTPGNWWAGWSWPSSTFRRSRSGH